ncbi:hypothetical protein BH11BAC3_BH11BAC3_21730 [soil metagenome]
MQNAILVVDPHIKKEAWLESYVSFNKFISFLQDKIAIGKGMRLQQYQDVLNKILAHPELQGNIAIEEMHKYTEVLEVVSCFLFPGIEDENECFWGIANAMTPEIFYESNALYNMMEPASKVYIGESFISAEESSALQKELLYQMILQQVYEYRVSKSKEWIHGFINDKTGLYQYFRVNIDKRFVDVKPRSSATDMCKTDIATCLSCTDGYTKLEQKIPICDFVATGFSIVTLTDVTAQHAVEQIGLTIAGINKKNKSDIFNHIKTLLKTIIQNGAYDFGITPIFTINNRPGLLYENFSVGILVTTCFEQGVPKNVFNHFINDYLLDPKAVIFMPGVANSLLPDVISNALTNAGIEFYSFVPVYNNEQLVGLFELSTSGKEILSEQFLRNKLGPVLPYISQLLQHSIEKVNHSIEAIIKDKFTTLQPSVEWKFNEVAWHYFRNNFVEEKVVPLENISFTDVYPLYGAIDIRNSTIERNKALRKDLLVQLNGLREIFLSIENHFDNAAQSFLTSCDYWLYQLSNFITIEQELILNDFLQFEVNKYLLKFEENEIGNVNALIREYRQTTDEEQGLAFLERRRLESSIQMINNAVGQYFDLFKLELQEVYPCYFEKIRTDGIEYDIYIGQSIAPKTPFNISFFKKLRLMQVQSMAAISKLTHSLVPQLEHELHTTQLMFAHSRSIDISFRNDERRFDVEGAYNIRYHIIKKRIDKVHLRNSDERLTQVGKIALVYYNEKDAIEYEGYFRKLREDNILTGEIEHLDLEELQGVSGLKALRVTVNFE